MLKYDQVYLCKFFTGAGAKSAVQPQVSQPGVDGEGRPQNARVYIVQYSMNTDEIERVFSSKEAAEKCAENMGIDYEVVPWTVENRF